MQQNIKWMRTEEQPFITSSEDNCKSENLHVQALKRCYFFSSSYVSRCCKAQAKTLGRSNHPGTSSTIILHISFNLTPNFPQYPWRTFFEVSLHMGTEETPRECTMYSIKPCRGKVFALWCWEALCHLEQGWSRTRTETTGRVNSCRCWKRYFRWKWMWII